MTDLWRLMRGDAPLVVNIPHAGTFLPAEIACNFTPAGRSVADTDWHVDRLYDFIPSLGATLMVATHSRFVVDLNRDPSGASLYPGASNTELCPTATFHDEAVYLAGKVPDPVAVAAHVDRYWRPYHAQLAAEVARVRSRHGYCVLLDGHSIISEAPRFFTGRLPDLNLGTADGASCDAGLANGAFALLSQAQPFTAVHNGRFKGGYITRHYGKPADQVHALQLEMAQCAYLDENNPFTFDPARALPLARVLRELVNYLLNWRPALGGSAET
jgi:N-formylglutamate amidohydrolase